MSFFTSISGTSIFLPALIALTVTLISTPLVIRFANHFGLVDDPRVRKHPAQLHRKTIPRAGGLAIYLGIIASALIFLPFSKQLWGILSGATVLVFVGLADDKFDLSPYLRLATNILAALLVVGSGVGISFITNPFDGIVHLDTLRIQFEFFGPHSIIVWADLFALVWIVWCMNMVNWSKGVDGQMPGFVGISAIFLGLLFFRFLATDVSQWTAASLAFITAGAFLGFLPFNFYPQKIMPGYGGGSLAGFMLAVLAILSGGKVATAILVLGVPMMDAVYTIFRRILRGRSPVWGDRGHLHHKLIEFGWGKRRIALFYWLVSAILGTIALRLNSQQKFFTIILLGLAVGGLLLWLNFWATFSRLQDQDNG
ncbi:MAG: MraY family glycosyltransferase [bacterium]|nr:MraY family glycosyltransferase [bacterium]